MNATAATLPHRSGLLSQLRRHDLFAGTGYAAFVTVILMVGWDFDVLLDSGANKGIWQGIKDALVFFGFMMVHQMPTVPLLAVALNLVPAKGFLRYACLTAVGVCMWAFCTAIFYYEGDDPGLNLEYAAMVVMIVMACAYRSSARSATGALMQSDIAEAALDADVKRARLTLLRAQIEPHFLFNTLATVRTLARVDRAAAIEMVDHLMRYLSEALPKMRRELCALEEEMQLVDAYLRIHQIRMGPRLSYELSVPDPLGHEQIPTMMLLTLVENAIKHGINPAIDGGAVHVRASRSETHLVLKVSDTGQGLAATDGHGMGLANIRRRLMMLYGDGAILSLARPAASGVTATVSIPLTAAR